MCGISKVAGASGAPPAKQAGSVGGASGAPTKVAGAKGGDAAKGATMIKGGGGSELSAALEGVKNAIKALKEAITQLQARVAGGGGGGCGAPGKVAGVQGAAAKKTQTVAKNQSIVPLQARATVENNQFEQRVHDLVNAERAKAGLAPVKYNQTVDNAAEKHASHMAKVGQMAHAGIGDGDPGQRIRAEGWNKAWGENVATGQRSPEQVVREWMDSPTHRRNILDPNFREMGVALAVDQSGRTFWAQEFGA
ncbi:MAG: CAP domain-containing protein [Gaiellales bacterium]